MEQSTTEGNFWGDNEKAQEILKKIKLLKDIIDKWESTTRECDDTFELFSYASEENDAAALAELKTAADTCEKDIVRLEFMHKLSGEDDACNAVLMIHSGAGGTESCDWCDMLFRMYCR